VDEEELLGDEEMMMYIRRQHAKKLAAGATQQELDDMLKFPEPIPPASPSTPSGKPYSVLLLRMMKLSSF
jgi:dual specificity tyrosine-phosphorylation-regulated kinase 2/3/4